MNKVILMGRLTANPELKHTQSNLPVVNFTLAVNRPYVKQGQERDVYKRQAYTSLLLISSLSDYLHSLYIEKHRGTQRAKIALVSSIAVNLALLGFFKYADFLISTVNGLLHTSIPLLKVPLPIGISFFTFQTMSYTIVV